MRPFLIHLLKPILRLLVRTAGRIVYRIQLRGGANIPTRGGALLVASHSSFMDFVLIVCTIRRPVRFIMNAKIFRMKGLRWILEGIGCVPVESGMTPEAREVFNREVAEQIRAGHLVAIFAEGTVTRTGQLLEFKKGVEHITRLVDCPVIPIHFDNVIGTPFTYRAGKEKPLRAKWRSLRRPVSVNIGRPQHVPVSAFHLRQRVKELEADSFAARFDLREHVGQRLKPLLEKDPVGCWSQSGTVLHFKDLPAQIALFNEVTGEYLADEKTIGILLPTSPEQLLVTISLITAGKCVVNLDPEFSNEEQFAALKHAGIHTIITTHRAGFSRFAATSERVFFVEDIREALRVRKPLHQVCEHVQSVSRAMRSFFRQPADLHKPVTIVFERLPDGDLQPIHLTHLNVLASIGALRQVYFFQSGTAMLADLDLHHAYGFVLQLLMPLFCDLRLELLSNDHRPSDFIHRLLDTQPPLVLAKPRQLEALADLARTRNLPFLTTVFTADLDPSHSAASELIDRGLAVMTCAGMNKTTGVFSVNLANVVGSDINGKPLEQEASEPGSYGKPLPGICVRIVDEDRPGREPEPGESGWIEVRGAAIAGAPDSATWISTGMRGSLNSRGFLYPEK